MKILIVDDSALSRSTTSKIVMETKQTVALKIAEAVNGIEALEKHRLFKPELIFLDITMPHLDGVTTLRTIRLTDWRVVIVMITALGSHQHIATECLKLGASDIVAKPVDCVILHSIIHKVQAGLLVGGTANHAHS